LKKSWQRNVGMKSLPWFEVLKSLGFTPISRARAIILFSYHKRTLVSITSSQLVITHGLRLALIIDQHSSDRENSMLTFSLSPKGADSSRASVHQSSIVVSSDEYAAGVWSTISEITTSTRLGGSLPETRENRSCFRCLESYSVVQYVNQSQGDRDMKSKLCL
jgi:hypothetical protein